MMTSVIRAQCAGVLLLGLFGAVAALATEPDALDDAPPIVPRPMLSRPMPASLPEISAGGVRLAVPSEGASDNPTSAPGEMARRSANAPTDLTSDPAAADSAADDDAPRRRPQGSNALLVTAERPQELVWDAERHVGALSVRDHLLILEELRDHAGRPAGALGLVTALPVTGIGQLTLARDTGLVYASSARAGTVHAVGLVDGAVQASFRSGGPQPGVVFYHPALHRLASFNAGASTLTLFDAASQAFEGLIPIGDAPVAARLAPDGRVLVLLPERRELTLLGLRPLRIYSRWAVPGDCLRPHDLDVDPAGLRVLVACGTPEIAVFSLRDNDWTANLVGTTTSADIGRVFWDGTHKRVIAVAADGGVTQAAIDPANVALLATVPAGSRLAHDPAGNRLVVASPDDSVGLSLGFVSLK